MVAIAGEVKRNVKIGDSEKQATAVRLPKLLLVENERVDIRLVQYLVRDRYRFFSAMNAEDAMKILTTDKDISLILTDLRLRGGKNAVELAIDLKNSPEFKNIPIIVMSGLEKADAVKYMPIPGTSALDKENKLNELFVDYLEKGSYDNATLTAKIDQYAIPVSLTSP